jgi:hypothetical protein
MANADDGILGRFRGKIGTVVGVSSGDRFYMRSLPRKRTKTGPKELINQAKFKAVIDHLKPLKELVKAGFKGHYTKTGGHRAAFAYNRKHAIAADDNGVYIDPALFRFSGGVLPGAVNPAVSLANDLLEITWDIADPAEGSPSDQLMVLLYDTANAKVLTRIFDGPFRAAGSYRVSIPALLKGLEAELYIGFVAADRSAQSDSQYLGRFAL